MVKQSHLIQKLDAACRGRTRPLRRRSAVSSIRDRKLRSRYLGAARAPSYRRRHSGSFTILQAATQRQSHLPCCQTALRKSPRAPQSGPRSRGALPAPRTCNVRVLTLTSRRAYEKLHVTKPKQYSRKLRDWTAGNIQMDHQAAKTLSCIPVAAASPKDEDSTSPEAPGRICQHCQMHETGICRPSPPIARLGATKTG